MCTASLHISCVRHHHQVSNNFKRIDLIYLWAKIYPGAVISYPIILKQPFVTSTTFMSVFSCPQERTNPAILMDAIQWTKVYH